MKFLVKNCQITKKEKEKQMNDVIKRWKRGSRTDMVKENGKVYYRICKCGLEKESYKCPMCNACEKEYYRKRRQNKDNYDIVIKDLVVKGKEKDKSIDTSKKRYRKNLFEFVNKIERRNGLASMEDIFVDMITLFNYYVCNQDIDILPTGIQLQMMWEFLRDYKIKRENGKK